MTTYWFEGNALTNGIRMHYYRTGGARGNGKPQIVLCHGATDYGLNWTELARDLESEYDVVMIDARCHGKSEAPSSGDNGTAAQAADLAGLIRALDLDRPVVAGHSMGASCAFETAGRYPELVRAIILEDPGWRDGNAWWDVENEELEKLMQRMVENIRRRNAMSIEELMNEGREESPKWSEETLHLWAISKQLVDERMVSRYARRTDWRKLLEKVACPILLITAEPELGSLVTPEVAQEAKETASDLTVARIAEAGHCIRYDRYPAYRDIFGAGFERLHS